MRLIDVEELKDRLFEKRSILPEWVNSAIKKCTVYELENCNHVPDFSMTSYCPRCGSNMDGDNE